MLEFERGSTRSDCLENSFWRKLRTYRKTDHAVNNARNVIKSGSETVQSAFHYEPHSLLCPRASCVQVEYHLSFSTPRFPIRSTCDRHTYLVCCVLARTCPFPCLLPSHSLICARILLTLHNATVLHTASHAAPSTFQRYILCGRISLNLVPLYFTPNTSRATLWDTVTYCVRHSVEWRWTSGILPCVGVTVPFA